MLLCYFFLFFFLFCSYKYNSGTELRGSNCVQGGENCRRCTKIESRVPRVSFPVASQNLHTSLLQGQGCVKSFCRNSGTSVFICACVSGLAKGVGCACGQRIITHPSPVALSVFRKQNEAIHMET